MDQCFVMQPFDGGKFDSRYEDVIDPAIQEAGLEPYRVDDDPSSEILIETIEEEIRKSKACVAEITTNNPNVWYELGYALALRKKVLIMCSDEREEQFPFDVRHRNILKYNTRSLRDYKELGEEITERLEALLSKNGKYKNQSSDNDSVKYIKRYELDLLQLIASESVGSTGPIPENSLLEPMKDKGYNDFVVRLGLKRLQLRDLIIKYESDHDQFGNTYYGYRITDSGYSWIMENEDAFDIRQDRPTDTPAPDQVYKNPSLEAKDQESSENDGEDTFEPDDDLPF